MKPIVAFFKFIYHQTILFWRNLIWHVRLKKSVDHTGAIKRHDILLVGIFDRRPAYLEHFLAYHKKLGVQHFLLVQTYRGNALAKAVADRNDVTVFTGRFSALPAAKGFRIKNAILQRYAHGHLCVLVNCDEYVAYPKMETRSLRDLGDFLRNERRLGLMSIAIDRYGEAPIGTEAYGQSGDPFTLCPYFDRDHYFEAPVSEDMTEVRGGIVGRMKGSGTPREQVLLNRIPIVWWKWSNRLTDNDYGMVPLKAMRVLDWKNPVISGAVMRFPFLSGGFDGENQHRRMLRDRYGKGHERLLARKAELFEPSTSVTTTSSRDLIEAGLMSSGNWF